MNQRSSPDAFALHARRLLEEIRQENRRRERSNTAVIWLFRYFDSEQIRYIVGAGILLTAALISIQVTAGIDLNDTVTEVAAILSGTVALLFGYIQWRRDKRNASSDSYYSRLDMANQRFHDWELDRLEGSRKRNSGAICRDEVVDHYHRMFVFAELDNLEYALGKYVQAFIEEELAARAVVHFLKRVPKFHDTVGSCVKEGAYEWYTHKVVQDGTAFGARSREAQVA